MLVNGYAAGPRRGADRARPGGRIARGAAVAGIAAGLAAGTKLSFLAPVAALLVGVVVIAGRTARCASRALVGAPGVRRRRLLVRAQPDRGRQPDPVRQLVGPISLPAPERDFELRPGFSVVHYWNDTDVWWDWFFPGLDESFGVLWPLTLAAFSAAAPTRCGAGGEPLVRVLGAVVLFTAIAYLFTPLTAAGEEGQPIAFVWNVRYIAPAAAVGLAIAALPADRARARARRAG